jgi:2,4'-dihydroxyacetophenone dioxygenase
MKYSATYKDNSKSQIESSAMELPEPVNITTLPETPLESGHLNHNDFPWVDQGWGIEAKVLQVCNVTGSWIIMNRFAPGTQLPTHRHSGVVKAYTLQGKWGYLESNFTATAGSIIMEPANTAHTLKVADNAGEPTVVFFTIEGSLVNYTEDGTIWGISDGHTQLAEYIRLGKEQGHLYPHPS